MLDPNERAEVERLFALHGYSGAVRVAKGGSRDECVFVVPDGVLATLVDAHGLQAALWKNLDRKVLIVGDSPAWWANSEPLD